MNGLVSVGELMHEFRAANSSQLELLRKHGIRSAASHPRGRGYAHYVTPEDAELLRLHLKLQGKRQRTPRKAPAAPVQLHLDAIEGKESFWSRAKQAFHVLVGH